MLVDNKIKFMQSDTVSSTVSTIDNIGIYSDIPMLLILTTGILVLSSIVWYHGKVSQDEME